MHELLEQRTIVLAGAWNTRIFSPSWISSNLSQQKEVGIEIAMNNLAAPMRLVFDDIYLFLASDRIVVQPQNLTDSSHRSALEIASKIVKTLPHTPISAIGINFGFLEREPGADLVELFAVSDNDSLADAGAKIVATSITRSLEIEDQAVNLIIDFNEAADIAFDINYNRRIGSGEEPALALDIDVIELRAKTVQLLSETYSLEINDSHVA